MGTSRSKCMLAKLMSGQRFIEIKLFLITEEWNLRLELLIIE